MKSPRRGRRNAGRAHMMQRVVIIALLLVAGFAGFRCQDTTAQQEAANPIAAAGADVPMYRANPARTGVMPGPGPEGRPVELWRFQVEGEIHSAPAIVGGVLYIGGGDGGVYALDAGSGEELWRFHADNPISSSPAVVDGLGYVGSDNGTLYA